MLDDFDGFIAALADGFDGAVGLVELLALVVLWFWGFGGGMREKMTHGGDFGLEELRLQKRVVTED